LSTIMLTSTKPC
ncbi:cyclic nucleotide-binding domain protein, partial [Vibrio parahaemolyticus V-223/04]